MVYSLGAMVAAVVGWFASLSLSLSRVHSALAGGSRACESAQSRGEVLPEVQIWNAPRENNEFSCDGGTYAAAEPRAGNVNECATMDL